MAPKDAVVLAKRTVNDWLDDSCERLGAALAFYTVWSIGPLFLVVISIAGLVFGRDAAQGRVLAVLKDFVGPEGAKSIQDTIVHANASGHSVLANIIGIVLLLVSASGVFAELKSSLNLVWEIAPKSGSFWATIKARLWSVTVVLGTGFLLLVTLLVQAALSALSHAIHAQLPGGEIVGQIVHFFLSIGITTCLFALMFKFIPDAKVAWKDVWLGAVVTGILFTVGQILIGLYLGNTSIGSAYGAASSLMIVVVWIYFSACILFLGAEFTQVHADMFGKKIQPAKNAIKVPEGMTPLAATEQAKGDEHAQQREMGEVEEDLT
ncbi:MAG: YihY/virulence factor BrkB family protein [Polyangiaceae bacterium]